MQPIREIFPLLLQPRNVVITMHQKPDADAMGASLGLYHFLKSFGHSLVVISPTNWASWLNWMPGCKDVIDYEYYKQKAEAALDSADWIFCLDFNTLDRTKNMQSKLQSLLCTKILIDHHHQPAIIFDYGISNTLKSSTCELVYDLIVESGNSEKITPEIGQCIYAGVIADTGSFRFPSTDAGVHRLVAHLKDKGLEHSFVHEAIFDNFLENRLRFTGHVLLYRMDVFYEFNTVLMAVPKIDILKFDIKTGDTEGLVNYPLTIQGIKLAALVIDRDEERKWSFRSKGDFDCNSFARKYFNGGGHYNASGGRDTEPLERTVQKFIQAIKENELILQ